MLIALARIVSTKVVLRPEAKVLRRGDDKENGWDFLFHQDGMVGSAILFANAQCGNILHKFPPRKVNDTFAVSFVVSSAAASTGNEHARAHVSKIAKLKINRRAFDQQAARLMETNPVYRAAEYDEALVAAWIPNIEGEMVPQPILDAVICVPTEGDPGKVVTEGPADATINGQQEREDADVQAAKQARYISAFEPKVTDLNADAEQATGEVVSLLDQLEALDRMTQRSVALETLSAVEGGASLVDAEGRARVLEISRDVLAKCCKLNTRDAQAKLEQDMQKGVLGVAGYLAAIVGTDYARCRRR